MAPPQTSGASPGRRYARRLVLILSISLALALVDQLVKAYIVRNIPLDTIGLKLWNDFLWVVHTRNLGIAFSIGDGVSRLVRLGLFVLLPAGFLVFAVVFSVRSEALSLFQRVAIAIIAGGGLGNLLDRIFRPEGVVDFLSFSLFGIFGMDRFPTFNVADSCITVGACLVLLSGFLGAQGGRDDERR